MRSRRDEEKEMPDNYIGGIGMCGSGAFLLSAAQVDRRLKAVATVSMADISRAQPYGARGTLTEEERTALLDVIAEQRYAEFDGNPPALTPRGAPLGFGDTTRTPLPSSP
jgi:hypothetical protein